MNKNLLIRHFQGLCSEEEEAGILSWVEADIRNRAYYSELRDLFIISTLPSSQCSASEMEIPDKIVRNSSKKKEKHCKRRIIGCFLRYSAVACVAAVLAFMAGEKFIEKRTPVQQRVVLSELPGEVKHTIYTEKGVKSVVTLPDGSQVWMNSDTKLVFPDRFIGDTREVYLSGEAYFKVVHNPEVPMIVTTNRNFIVKVLGTEFNIRSYSNDDNAKTTLYKGSIEMYSRDRSSQYKFMARLSPCQSYVYRDRELPTVMARADTLANSAWKRGCLIFNSEPMEQVFKELERWHGVHFEVLDPRAYNYQFNADFENTSLIQILESLKFCTDIDYALKDNKVDIFIKEKK